MRIREGKRYVTRDGRVTGRINREPDSESQPRLFWSAYLPGKGETAWFHGGRWLAGDHPLDLVAEYREDGK